MLLYVVAYDVPCQKRRTKVANVLLAYGKRVQLSVFECVLSAREFGELRLRLERVMRSPEDSVRMYPISGQTMGQVVILGGVPLTKRQGSIVV